MEAEDLVFDEGGKREVIEEVGEVFPDIGISILAQALVVETVHLCNLTGLVVAAQDCDTLRITNFEGDKESHSLDGKVPTINVVTFKIVRNDYSKVNGCDEAYP